MQHADNRDAIRYHFVEDHISPEREASQARSQFLTAAAEHGLLREEPEFRVDIVDECIRACDAVVGDVVLYLDQIIGSAGTPEDDRHLCFGGAGLAGSLRPPLTLDLLSIPGCGRAAA